MLLLFFVSFLFSGDARGQEIPSLYDSCVQHIIRHPNFLSTFLAEVEREKYPQVFLHSFARHMCLEMYRKKPCEDSFKFLNVTMQLLDKYPYCNTWFVKLTLRDFFVGHMYLAAVSNDPDLFMWYADMLHRVNAEGFTATFDYWHGYGTRTGTLLDIALDKKHEGDLKISDEDETALRLYGAKRLAEIKNPELAQPFFHRSEIVSK